MKTIAITGAASGIGRATALRFAQKGWYVGLFDIDAEPLAALAGEIGESRCGWARMDVADRASVAPAFAQLAAGSGGHIDVLFNNAGILRVGFFDELTLDEQLREVEVNLKGVLHCTHAALPYLQKSRDARVIGMSSASAIYGTAHLAVYSATKAALSSLTESLNMELARWGIHVCDIRVPYVRTPLLETPIEAASLKTLGARLGPDDVAAMVYNCLNSRKVHYDSLAMLPLLLLRRLSPAWLQRLVLKPIMMPKQKKTLNLQREEK
jgi:NAD(P)-dependent dehydrogenase (short-subunit alcohol dehydrogenase family)